MKCPATLLTCELIGAALLPGAVCGAEWQREAGVSMSAYISDNVCLRDSDKDVRGAATITPDVYLRGEGARASLYLAGAVEYNSLADSDLDCGRGPAGRGNRQAVVPRLRYRGDLEVIDNWLTLESDAFVGRNPIDPFAAGGRDNLNARDNTNITYHYGVGALLERPVFDAADLRLRYRYSEQYNEVNVLGDSSEDRVEFDLGTERSGNRFTTGVAGRYSNVQYEASDQGPAFDNTLSSAEIRAALQFNPAWQINGLVGEEWNEFTSARDDVDGGYWDAGVRWTPNDRIEVSVGTGERFFGTTPRALVRYHHKRRELVVSYERTLTFPRNLRTAGNFDDPLVPGIGGDPNFGQLPGDPLMVDGQPTFLGNTPVINERLAMRYRFTGRRTTITFAAANSEQERTEDGGEAEFSDVSLTFSRSLSATLTGNARLSWSEREGQGGNVGPFGQRSQTWRAGVGFTRQLGNDTTVTLGYQHARQESDFVLNRYSENRVTLSIRHQF